jgi:hypothetical protein
MKPLFHSQVVNGATGDPASWVDLPFERRAYPARRAVALLRPLRR